MIDEPLVEFEPFVHGDGTQPWDLTRKQAQGLHEKLLLSLPTILASVREAVTRDGVILGNGPRDDSESVGEWLVARSRLVPAARPAEPDPFWVNEPVLSVPTMSACCRVAYFFGESLKQVLPEAEWRLDTSNKRHIYYHQTVLMVPGSKSMLQPVGVVLNLVRLRLIDHHPCTLGEFFDSWINAFGQR